MPDDKPTLKLYQCDGPFGGEKHWSRQRTRLTQLTWNEDGHQETETKALCLDHYNELRKVAEPRHDT